MSSFIKQQLSFIFELVIIISYELIQYSSNYVCTNIFTKIHMQILNDLVFLFSMDFIWFCHCSGTGKGEGGMNAGSNLSEA